jgi:hypothetical protein
MPELDDRHNAPEARHRPPANVTVETCAGGLEEDQLEELARKVFELLRYELMIERERQALGHR